MTQINDIENLYPHIYGPLPSVSDEFWNHRPRLTGYGTTRPAGRYAVTRPGGHPFALEADEVARFLFGGYSPVRSCIFATEEDVIAAGFVLLSPDAWQE